MGEKKTRVLIVEDHRFFREGLKSLLADKTDFEVEGEAGDGLEAIRKIKRSQPNLLLLDLSMPKMNGIFVVREIKGLFPENKNTGL